MLLTPGAFGPWAKEVAINPLRLRLGALRPLTKAPKVRGEAPNRKYKSVFAAGVRGPQAPNLKGFAEQNPVNKNGFAAANP